MFRAGVWGGPEAVKYAGRLFEKGAVSSALWVVWLGLHTGASLHFLRYS